MLLRVWVTPRARRNAVEGLIYLPDGLALRVAVTVPPEDSKAKTAVLKLIAKTLGLPKTSLSVGAGKTSRSKSIFIPGDVATLAPMLEALITSGDPNHPPGRAKT